MSLIFKGVLDAFKLIGFQPNFKHTFLRAYIDNRMGRRHKFFSAPEVLRWHFDFVYCVLIEKEVLLLVCESVKLNSDIQDDCRLPRSCTAE